MAGEGKYADLNKDELIRLLEARDRRTRFGLVWEANEIERDAAVNRDFVALDLCPELSCGAGPWRNLIIEGDNFDALRALKMAYAGQVKCIYIDPPYNTGNRDFVYNDHFVDRDDSWRHSTWCEFMFQRLVLAKELLRQDGIIFVSIDDNEAFHLGLLMNKVFGEANWVSSVIWKKSYGGGAKAKHVVGLHEYVLCYAQSKEQLGAIQLPPNPDTLKYYKGRDARFEARGPYRLQPLATTSMDARPNLRYPIPYKGEEIWPEKQWQWSKERALIALENDELVITKAKEKWSVNYKQYLKSEAGDERGAKPFSIIDGPYTQVGTNEIRNIFGDGKAFSFPKPTGLIEQLLTYVIDDKDALILDFFAGSGTTAHAVHKLNHADGGRRRCILVSSTERTDEQPDKNLCRDACATRVRRVIEGYRNADGEDVPGLGGDFAYLRAQPIPAGELLDIGHGQVWTALQLIHMDTLSAYQEGPFLWAGDDDEALCYVPRFRREDAPVLRAAVKGSSSVALYSWQPALVRQHVRAAHVSHLPIPETLTRRFGLLRPSAGGNGQ